MELKPTQSAIQYGKVSRNSNFFELSPSKNLGYSEETSEYHLPGHNYLGPGTHVVDRVKAGSRPVNKIDAIALKHDMEYLRDENTTKADINMVSSLLREYPYMPQIAGLAATAFGINKILNIGKAANRPDVYSSIQSKAKDLLMDYNLTLDK